MTSSLCSTPRKGAFLQAFSYFFLLILCSTFSIYAEEKTEETGIIVSKSISPRAGDKKKIKYQNGDVNFTFGTTMKLDIWQGKNTTLLNNNLPDEFGYIKQTIDFTTDFIWGEETFEHKAFEIFAGIRQKSLFGDGGKFVGTSREFIRFDDIVDGKHGHITDKLLIWLRTAYMEVSLNALCGRKGDGLIQYLRAGFFPFEVGRGIALGDIYGSSCDFLGIQTSYLNDTNAPGFLLHGDIIADTLSYDFYYAKLEEHSASFGETFALTKFHLLNNKFPWRGLSQDNDLLAGRISWTVFDGSPGTLELEPYLVWNDARDRSIEVSADASIKLGITGIAAEYSYNNFEFGGEAAFNFGHQDIHAIDRNSIKIRRDSEAVMVQQYSHVVEECFNQFGVGQNKPNDKKPVLRTNEIKDLVKANLGSHKNCELIGTTDDGKRIYNASNRYRCGFRNKFRGWMAVLDAAYLFESVGLKPAICWGYASGDDNPNLVHQDSTYKGFIGLQEGYSGKRVQSLFVLGARKTKRPFFVAEEGKEAGDDSSFTDLQFVGGGLTWTPWLENTKALSFETNILAFWKAHAIGRFDIERGKSLDVDTCPASKFMGVEWNIRARYEALKDLRFFIDAGLFFPGQFYKDVRGTKLRDDVIARLDHLPHVSGKNASKFRIGTDMAYLVNVGSIYNF